MEMGFGPLFGLVPEYVYRRYHVGAVYLHFHRDLWP